ncbi:MAG: type I restriction enzyme endonuclease domain-containing protein, partial [Patescibacteria group bacterium]
AYQKFSERLMAIRQEFEQNQIDLAERIRRYEQLMKDIRTKGDEAKEMGLDLKEYALYVISQEFIEAGKDEAIKEFVKDLRIRVEDELDEGWQESSKRDAFIKDVKQTLQELILRDYKDRFSVKDFPKFLNRLVDIVTKKF